MTVDPGISLAQRQLQERAVSLWANGCDYGCRICKKLGFTFSSFSRQGLVKHLLTDHEVSGEERAEYSCLTLVMFAEEEYKA